MSEDEVRHAGTFRQEVGSSGWGDAIATDVEVSLGDGE
jgi:hypothetical protein